MIKQKSNNKKFISPNKPFKKKSLGQHFLREQSVVDHMIDKVNVSSQTNVMEIGCGDGFLTKSILNQTSCKLLVVYEIDTQWADFVRKEIDDDRLDIRCQNILDLDFSLLEPKKSWVLLSNLPYQITFPILFLLQKNKSFFQDGVIMVQEEVAQKLIARKGKPYSSTSLFLRYNFDFELMEKISPEAFSPAPKVFSRLVYFKPRFEKSLPLDFWKFVKLCFKFPRQKLKNNLKSTHYDYLKISTDYLDLRAQQLSFDQFLEMWRLIKN